jgi:hypothetical protein
MRSSTSPVTNAKTASSATRHGPVEVPVAFMSTVEAAYPAISSAINTIEGTTPNGSPDGGSLLVLSLRMAFC